jgi:hypothetical protein
VISLHSFAQNSHREILFFNGNFKSFEKMVDVSTKVSNGEMVSYASCFAQVNNFNSNHSYSSIIRYYFLSGELVFYSLVYTDPRVKEDALLDLSQAFGKPSVNSKNYKEWTFNTGRVSFEPDIKGYSLVLTFLPNLATQIKTSSTEANISPLKK